MKQKSGFGISAVTMIGAFFAGLGLILLFAGLMLGTRTSIPVLPVVLELLGGCLLFVGLLLIVSEIKNRGKMMDAVRNGEAVQARITQLEENPGIKINGGHPSHIICEYRDPDLGVNRVFRGMDMQDLSDSLIGKTVTVYVSRKDDSNYYVDVTSIASAAEKR